MSDNKVMIDPTYNKTMRQKRIEREEKELEELMKQSSKPKEEEQEVEVEEEVEAETPDPENTEEESTKDSNEEEPQEEELSGEEKTFKKRYGDLRRHSQKVEKELREEIEKLKNKNPSVVPPTSDEDLEEWAKKYPEVASIVTTIAEKKAKEMMSSAEERLSKIDELQAEADRKAAEAKIMEVHKDFKKLRDSDEFHNWVENEPKWIQDALYENENDAKAVIRILDLYKAVKGMNTKDEKDTRKEAAKSVAKGSRSTPDPKGGQKKFSESVVAKMSDREYEENEEDILAAMASGNFVYDMTR